MKTAAADPAAALPYRSEAFAEDLDPAPPLLAVPDPARRRSAGLRVAIAWARQPVSGLASAGERWQPPALAVPRAV